MLRCNITKDRISTELRASVVYFASPQCIALQGRSIVPDQKPKAAIHGIHHNSRTLKTRMQGYAFPKIANAFFSREPDPSCSNKICSNTTFSSFLSSGCLLHSLSKAAIAKIRVETISCGFISH